MFLPTDNDTFWMTVASTVASTVCNVTLIVDLVWTRDFARKGSGLTERQRALMVTAMFLFLYLGGQCHSASLSRIETEHNLVSRTRRALLLLPHTRLALCGRVVLRGGALTSPIASAKSHILILIIPQVTVFTVGFGDPGPYREQVCHPVTPRLT